MTLELNIVNLQRQPLGFNDVETSILNRVEDFSFDDEFDEIFAIEYELFLIDDELEYDVFQFDDLGCASKCVISFVSEDDFPSASLNLKPLPNSLKYSSSGLDDSLPVIIASDLDWDQEEKLIDLDRARRL